MGQRLKLLGGFPLTLLCGRTEDLFHPHVASGSRTDREIANIPDHFLVVAWRKLRDYGKHCMRPPS